MENCIFCKIIKNEIPSVKIWEDDKFLAILDINPNTEGMALVLTKEHFDSDAFLMPDKDFHEFMSASKKVSEILKAGLSVSRVAMVMEGMGVNHTHIKLYPLHGIGGEFKEIWSKDMVFFKEYPGYISTQLGPSAGIENLKKIAEKIKANQ